jgi:hypothetical protein
VPDECQAQTPDRAAIRPAVSLQTHWSVSFYKPLYSFIIYIYANWAQINRVKSQQNPANSEIAISVKEKKKQHVDYKHLLGFFQ